MVTCCVQSVWTPPPSVQSLVDKVERVEARLAHLETLIARQVDPAIRTREQVSQRRGLVASHQEPLGPSRKTPNVS